jgi:uncharacterized protein (DUF1810 family)
MAPDLERFVDAQQPIYDQVCLELRGGVLDAPSSRQTTP